MSLFRILNIKIIETKRLGPILIRHILGFSGVVAGGSGLGWMILNHQTLDWLTGALAFGFVAEICYSCALIEVMEES